MLTKNNNRPKGKKMIRHKNRSDKTYNYVRHVQWMLVIPSKIGLDYRMKKEVGIHRYPISSFNFCGYLCG